MEKITHIVIIGNGFDLNLGLKSGYQDYIKSAYFESLISKRNYLAMYLKKQNNLQRWIDIENELKNTLKSKYTRSYQYL